MLTTHDHEFEKVMDIPKVKQAKHVIVIASNAVRIFHPVGPELPSTSTRPQTQVDYHLASAPNKNETYFISDGLSESNIPPL